MLVESALKGHCRAAHGVLQTLNCALVAFAGNSLAGLLAVVLNEGLQFAAARIQGAGEIQSDVSRVVVVRLSELVRPIVEQLPFVGTFFGYLDRVSVHSLVACL